MQRTLSLAIAIVLSAASLAAQKSKPLTDSELAEISARGRFLAEYDNASWHATDAVLALKPEDGAIGRYIARKTDAGWVVVFGRLNEAKDSFLIVYEAIQGSDPQQFTVKKYDPPQDDVAFYLIAARAIGTALRNSQLEKRPYNTCVLPLSSGQMYVYVLPAQTKTDIYPLGGDVRYLMSADGATIVETRQLHKTILENKPPDKSAKRVAGFHTHALTDVPEDTDVFHVLRQKPPLPEYVGTKSGIYVVQTDGTILRGK
ncbi:MAG TPA: hypothetical protein VN881_02850 [Candidatus Acidoferrales bacterium]|nr:hypothetical protein [Candidatus Acidoferrales bacterium]